MVGLERCDFFWGFRYLVGGLETVCTEVIVNYDVTLHFTYIKSSSVVHLFALFFFLLHFFLFHYPSSVFIPIIRHNSFDFVYYWRYYHYKVSQHCHDFVFFISRRLWTFCFGHQLWSFLISCVFQPVFISLFEVPKDILLWSILGILESSIFHCHGHWLYVWSAIGVYLNDYQTMSLKPIFAFRPGAICLKDSMIFDWMICVRMCLHRPRPFSNFFLSNLQGYTIDQEWLRLTSWAFHATGSLLLDLTFLLFGRKGDAFSSHTFG